MGELQKVGASAPTRADLAGGTLDIWPLNLFFRSPLTLNMALSLKTHVTITPRRDSKILLLSEDRKKLVEFGGYTKLHHKHPLPLLSRMVERFLKEGEGVEIVTRSDVPAGAGLAGSSALAITLVAALCKATGRKKSKPELIALARDIEAGLLKAPTGMQDYAAAVYGGVNELVFPAGGMERIRLRAAEKWLHKRVILFYSGSSRNSGINNWEMFKRIIDGDRVTLRKFESITAAANRAATALRAEDERAFLTAVNHEWKNRKALFPAISTKTIDTAIAAGRKAGGRAARICGAGGGGCFFLYADETKRQRVIDAVTGIRGVINLPYTLCPSGVTIRRDER